MTCKWQGRGTSKGLFLISHCLPFQMRREEIKAVTERDTNHKSACPYYRGFSLEDAIKQSCKRIHSIGLPHLPFSRLQSYLHLFNKEVSTITEYKHRMKVQLFINLQLYILQKLEKLFCLLLNVNILHCLAVCFFSDCANSSRLSIHCGPDI